MTHKILSSRRRPKWDSEYCENLRGTSLTALLKEGGVNLSLTVVDTPGFGDAVDNSDCWNPVLNYVESQYEAFLEAETKVQRSPSMADTRVHACLYFIAPSGRNCWPIVLFFLPLTYPYTSALKMLSTFKH